MTATTRLPRSMRLAAPLLAVLSASLGGCIGRTYGTGEYPEAAIFREMTGGMVGAVTRKDPKPKIDYTARAPLVEPPATALRPPVQTASLAESDWPVDPDKTAKPEVSDEINQEYRDRLKPLKALSRDRSIYRDDGFRGSQLESPAQFHANQNARKKFKVAVDEVEGVNIRERRYLTDPPEKYTEPAEGAPTEFEEVKRKRKGFLAGLFSRGT